MFNFYSLLDHRFVLLLVDLRDKLNDREYRSDETIRTWSNQSKRKRSNKLCTRNWSDCFESMIMKYNLTWISIWNTSQSVSKEIRTIIRNELKIDHYFGQTNDKILEMMVKSINWSCLVQWSTICNYIFLCYSRINWCEDYLILNYFNDLRSL